MSAYSTEYRVNHSPAYAVFSIILHAGAGLMLLFAGPFTHSSMLASALIAVAWLTLVIAAVRDLRCSGVWRGPNAVTHISVTGPRHASRECAWRLDCRSGRSFGPALVTGGRVMGVVVWLQLRDRQGRREALCVPADAMSPRMFRHLRIAAIDALGQ